MSLQMIAFNITLQQLISDIGPLLGYAFHGKGILFVIGVLSSVEHTREKNGVNMNRGLK